MLPFFMPARHTNYPNDSQGTCFSRDAPIHTTSTLIHMIKNLLLATAIALPSSREI